MSTAALSHASIRPSVWLAGASLWQREMVRFYRQRSRVVGVILSPLVFWLVLGAGFGRSFNAGTTAQNYLEYFFPGSLVMVVLFTSIFTMMSVIEDRQQGFLLSVMVAPVHRSAIVLGKVLGGTTLAAVQGLIFLMLAPAIGIRLGWEQILLTAAITFLIAFALTALGFCVAWLLDSPQAFHAIVNLVLIPLWLLSGALFPMETASPIIQWMMRANPLTYGMQAMRIAMMPQTSTETGLFTPVAVLTAFCALVFVAALLLVERRSHKAPQ